MFIKLEPKNEDLLHFFYRLVMLWAFVLIGMPTGIRRTPFENGTWCLGLGTKLTAEVPLVNLVGDGSKLLEKDLCLERYWRSSAMSLEMFGGDLP